MSDPFTTAWRPAHNRRSPHWPRPNECDDLASFEVLRHRDLILLDDAALRDQLALGRFLLGSVLSRSSSKLAESWLRQRIAAISDELRARIDPSPIPVHLTSRRPVHGDRTTTARDPR